jgi:hypothetical protein
MAANDPALADLGRNLSSRVRAISAADGDAHDRRRLLVQDLADGLIRAEPWHQDDDHPRGPALG